MHRIEKDEYRVPVISWIPPHEIEPGAMVQIDNAARHPDVTAHVALMPDVHQGFGVTIGSVFPTHTTVIPNAVGVDIGCGMCAIDTGVAWDRERMDRDFWRHWSGQVARSVPTGFNAHRSRQPLGELDAELRASSLQPLVKEKGALQIGTLGGGNHFMEAQIDERGIVWFMVHSGSRHTGLRIAGHYNELAKAVTERHDRSTADDLAFLPLDDEVGQDYLADAGWATNFALENRKRMLGQMLAAFEKELPGGGPAGALIKFTTTSCVGRHTVARR